MKMSWRKRKRFAAWCSFVIEVVSADPSVKQILEDYSSQLAHLTREMAQIKKDWAEWEASRPPSLAR